MRRRTVITGVAAFSPAGVRAAQFRDALLQGVPLVRPITTFDTTGLRSQCAAEIRDFEPSDYVSPMKLRRMDEVGRLSVASARTALDQAGWPPREDGYDSLGVVLGTCTCGVHSTGEFLERLQDLGPTGAPALLFSNTVGNAAASLVALEYRLRGPNTTVSYKEASGIAAMALAVDLIRAGRARALLTGGAEDIYDLYFKVHDWFGVLSRGGTHPEGARPFDVTRNGFVMGEGAYLVVLEDAETAFGRDVEVLGEIAGVGACGSSTPLNTWPTDSRAMARCMRAALEDAGLDPGDVGVVYAAANGSRELDAAEADAIRDVCGTGVAVTSTKAITGEGGMGASGSVVAAVLCGAIRRVPPVAGLDRPDPAMAALDWVVGVPRDLDKPAALVNGFASGGTLYSMVVRVPFALH